MRNARLAPRTCPVLTALGLGLTEPGACDARADRIARRGGGQIRGEVVADPRQPDRATVLAEEGRTPLRFQKPQVVQVDCEPSALDEYLVKGDQAAATAEAQHDLSLRCDQNRLSDLAAIHYETVLRHDPQFAPADQRLGRALYGGPWLSVGYNLNQAVPLRTGGGVP
jgi:hypothetical protein